jgi:dipeptidyl aminopeptidase/acylaminoacyl peptidase
MGFTNKSIFIAASCAMLILALPAVAASPARPSDIPIATFAQLPVMESVQLSPDGTQFAYLRPYQGHMHLAIEQLRPNGRIVIVPPPENLEFRWVHWANNDQLVLSMTLLRKQGPDEVTETRLLAVNKDGTGIRSIMNNATRVKTGSRVAVDMPPPRVQDDVIDWLPDDPEHILVSVDARRNDSFEVRRIHIDKGRYTVVQEGLLGVQHWLTDQDGEVRLGWGYRQKEAVVKFRNSDGKWLGGAELSWWDSGFSLLAFAEDPDLAFMLGPNENGRNCLRKMNLLTGEFVETVFEHESIDANGIVLDAARAQPVGVSYTVDMPKQKYFDRQMAILQRSVDKVLPQHSNQIVSLSMDHRQVLVYSSNATDPGSYYHWNREARSFDFIGEAMPNLPVELLSATEPVSYTARDGMKIPGYLTLPAGKDSENLPTIIFPHDGPDERVDQTFRYLTQFLASRGYAVLLPNFRGSSGYGSDFGDAGKQEWGGKMQDDITDGTRWLVEQGIADADRICIVGWSYGGYAAAMGAATVPDLYRCAVSINGVLDLARLAADDRNHTDSHTWAEHMGLKGERAKSISPYHQAEKVGIPMLIVQAKDDVRVPRVHGKSMADRLQDLGKDVQYLELEFGGHSVNYEPARREVLSALEQFLRQNIGS